MRPIYETDEDLDIEDRMMSAFVGDKPFYYVKQPYGFRIDYALFRDHGDDLVYAFVECKRRHNKRMAYPKYMLSYEKWKAGIALAESFNCYFFVLVQWDDGLYFLQATPETAWDCDVRRGGRIDRGDPQDQEDCIFIPVNKFREVSHGKRN